MGKLDKFDKEKFRIPGWPKGEFSKELLLETLHENRSLLRLVGYLGFILLAPALFFGGWVAMEAGQCVSTCADREDTSAHEQCMTAHEIKLKRGYKSESEKAIIRAENQVQCAEEVGDLEPFRYCMQTCVPSAIDAYLKPFGILMLLSLLCIAIGFVATRRQQKLVQWMRDEDHPVVWIYPIEIEIERGGRTMAQKEYRVGLGRSDGRTTQIYVPDENIGGRYDWNTMKKVQAKFVQDALIAHLAQAAPAATVGHDKEIRKRFREDPSSLASDGWH